MELIMVNSVKLKIILSPKDMEDMDISNETLDYGSAKTRKAFKAILERARLETGFDIKHDRIYVQVFPSVDGGCEMFLTRRGQLLPESKKNENTYLKKKYRLSSDYDGEKHAYIAESESIDDVIQLCIRLKREGFCGASSLYILDGKYYLITDFTKKYPSFVLGSRFDEDMYKFSFMSDYANLYFAENLPLACIKERGRIISDKNAVEIFARNFDNA